VLTLVCGIPGHGKTLYVVGKLAKEAANDGRQVFYAGIPECKVEGWKELPGANAFEPDTLTYTPEAIAAAHQWHRVPKKSVVVIDEAHQIFPQRGPSMPVPEWVGMAAVLRRLGIDLVLITQDGNSLDHFMRRRAGRYYHVWRAMGLNRATVWEFPKWCDWEDYHTREQAVKHQWSYPKAAFALYKSAEVHTVKRRIPLKVLWFPLGALAICASLFFGYRSLTSGTVKSVNEVAAKSSEAVKVVPGLPSAPAQAAPGGSVKSPREWLAARAARFTDFPESAPMYDALTNAVAFPVVVGCVQSAKACSCYSQQGIKVAGVSASFCKSFVRDGAFNPYQSPVARFENVGRPSPRAEQPVVAGAPVMGSTGNGAPIPPFPAERPSAVLQENGGQSPAGRRPRL